MAKEVQTELWIGAGADRSALWITFVGCFSPAEIFAFLAIALKQRFRVPVGALKIAVSGEQGEEGLAIFTDGWQKVEILRIHFPQQIQKLYAQGHGLQKCFVCDVQVNAAAQGALVLGGRGAEIHRCEFLTI